MSGSVMSGPALSPPSKISIVMPVRNGQDRIFGRVTRVLDALAELGVENAELIIVDDGSIDATERVLTDLGTRHSRVRVMRHSRPRGIEAAGQTGLERATGDLVFIQEADTDLRRADLEKLMRLAEDTSIIAARVESSRRPLSGPLLRRLRAFGTNADRQLDDRPDDATCSSLQLVRRRHLQLLAGPHADRYRLQSESTLATSIENS